MEKIKQILKPDKVLAFFIIICPILDMSSFLFRNKFNTNYSISTFIRPIIPAIIFVYLFFKRKNKVNVIATCIIYLAYALIHLLLYKNMMTKCSFGTVIHEAQYLVNYSFMILNLYIFKNVYDDSNDNLLRKSIVISLAIYIISIYISIITKTSSTTYIEGIGIKGWFESGNSISAILVLSTFIIMSFIMKIENKMYRMITFIILILAGVYLVTLIGTRVGLIGFVLAVLCFIMAQFYEKIVTNVKINKNNLIILLTILGLLAIIVVTAGSVTLRRRSHLRNMENTIIDQSTGEVSHLTGDLTVIRNKIINNELEEDFMTEAQKKSILDLYNIAEKQNVKNTDSRKQQMIYHCMLVKNQKNIILILFGNGYLINTNELVWEMEFPAFAFNFGLIGFALFMLPFIINLISCLKVCAKNIKKIDAEVIILLCAIILSFVLSTLSGYTFFNSSSMIIIIVSNVLIENKVKKIKVGLD